jgi:hypothetical protein
LEHPYGETATVNKHHPLGELIQSAQDKNGWSVRDLQRRAEDYGFEMKHSNFSRLKLHEVVTVKGDVIRMLAKVLALPEPMVARAALASMGIDLSATDSTVDEAVRTSTEFSERDRHIIQAVVDAMRSDAGSSTSGTIESKRMPTNPRTRRPFRRGSAEYQLYVEQLDREEPGKRGDSGVGQKTPDVANSDSVGALDDDSIDRLQQAKFDLAAKTEHRGIAHDEDPEET